MRALSGFLLLGGSLFCASHPVYAGGEGGSNVYSALRTFAGITLGADFIRTGHAQTLSVLPPFSNHYAKNSSYQSSGLLGLGLGVEQSATEQLSWQLGLSGYFNTEVDSTGHVWQFTLPEFDNFIYNYRIQSKRLMVTGKLLGTVKQTIHPYLSGELGAGFNRANNYRETSLIIEAAPMLPFSDHTKTSLAWGIGLGVDVDLNTSLRLGLGYQFANLGKISLGPSPAQLTQQTLGLPHLYSQEVRLQLTAFI